MSGFKRLKGKGIAGLSLRCLKNFDKAQKPRNTFNKRKLVAV